jgi:hypothetical protein
MINADMRVYDFSTLGKMDAYGQPTESKKPDGTIKMAINISSQSITDNVKFKDCSYIGLTLDGNVNDKYIIHYGDVKLKVLYVNPMGRYKQVYLAEV